MLFIIDGDWIDNRIKLLSDTLSEKSERLSVLDDSEDPEEWDEIDTLEEETAGLDASIDELNLLKQQLKPLGHA
jgi:hypothetical protein